MSSVVEFFYDYGSPYSYIANSQLSGLIERTGCTIRYRPMLLGGVFKATGNHSPAEEAVEAKRRYFGSEMKRWVDYLGLSLRSNPHFPVNTLLLMRCAHAAMARGEFETFHRAAFSALWEQEKNLADPSVLGEVLSGAGLEPGSLLENASDPEVKGALRETTEEAVARGVFGAPSFFVDGELFFGNDRLGFVERALN
ncbi:MAG: 2-hydroxychromene-2-carboxylate isomerase [Myxococcota bacterium]|nr:2-hydroxychromene-2-carboxylate isomerase [Myxococcota bacterium]